MVLIAVGVIILFLYVVVFNGPRDAERLTDRFFVFSACL